ncbi:YgjV family protein [Rhodohalobacter mucosus]|uniref:Inner membrane protein n=1 Tax=Rhodohalobacter mucosus TaxID=2079485 RepID=A0A316TTK7_9BACT|nr:YgjV family protein [Rhodohalobacter mucosus]PWN06649.1 hypothetical protein DDZ15_09035 [Rhodohalobacter mucosus]
METDLIYELIGYAASLLVAISLMMSGIVKLRIVNMVGAITFTVYGLLINSMPVAAMNAFIVIVNIYHLVNIYQKKTEFDLIQVKPDNSVLSHFLQYHLDEIMTHQPAYNPDEGYSFNLMIFNKMMPVGVVCGNQQGEILNVDLDFVIPSHRDFKAGEYLYKDRKEFFIDQGIRVIRASRGDKEHNRYLKKMGFSTVGAGNNPELQLASNL